MDDSGLDPELLDLLVEWEERKAAGTPVTPENLCRDCPERLDDLRRQVERIAQLDPLLALANPCVTDTLRIPGFELLDEIGRGGMGVVYRARDVSLDRVVAVKVPLATPGTALPRNRFEREARALAKLRHPHIVPVHAAGLAGDTPYFVMEYVGGNSLANRMGEVARTPGQIAALMIDVALAVDHAHGSGIVHRDLKPSNILLDDADRPYVSDFGVAALLAGESLTAPTGDTPDDSRPALTCLTRTGAAVGTPAYTAPELLPGRSGTPAATSDVWSLGVVLYECLTGRLPFPDPAAAGAGGQLLPPRSIRLTTPRRLEAIVMKCLAVDPAGRYPTSAGLARDLRKYLDRRGNWARRAGLFAAITVGILLGVMGEFGQRQGSQAQPEVTQTTLPPSHDPVAEQALVGERLVAGGKYKYEGTESHTGPFRPLVGGRGTPQRNSDGDGLSVTATSVELVEMRPDMPCSHYEFTAEVRVDDAGPVGESRAGLYVCFRTGVPVQTDDSWTAITTSFAELGRDAGDRPPPNQSSGMRILGWLSKDRAAREKTSVSIGTGPRYKPSFVARGPGPWRVMGVRVGPDGMTALWREDGEWIPPSLLSAAQCSKVLNTAAGYLQPWAAPLAGFHYQGGIGLYVHNCRATFRRVVIRSLPGT